MRVRLFLTGAVGLGLVALAPGLAEASVPQPALVSANGANYTPQVVPSSAITNPHVDAIAGPVDNMMFAGGYFDTISDGGPDVSVTDLASFDADTGVVSTAFNPQLAGGQVWSIAADQADSSVFVAGQFTSVNGTTRPPLVKLDAATGAVDTHFVPPFRKGRLTDVQLVTINGVRHLIVASNVGKRLWSLDPLTGKDDGYINSAISDPIPGAWGTWAVYHFAVDPSGTHLVATGNFQTVDGAARSKFFMLNLGAKAATLSPWYYPGFAKPCSSTAPRRIASLQGVDWSPDGKAFDVTATGQVPVHKSDIWYHDKATHPANTTVCDGVGRFALADDTKPVWINYTGGDSVWVVSDTGAGVYVQGHFKWLDNPDGIGSAGTGEKDSGRPAARRPGIGSIDPSTGLANTWNPGVTSKTGGKALLATTSGLWIGGDSSRFGSEQHYGIAFAPLLP